MASLTAGGGVSAAEPRAVTVYAAGSLRASFEELAAGFSAGADGAPVKLVFGASGLLRDRLVAGEAADVFASANMEHPEALAVQGRAEAVQPFARNALCALAAPGFSLGGDSLMQRLLDPQVKLGTSTPKADPSGDYAFALFDRAEAGGAVAARGAQRLKDKALQLTGGSNSKPPPAPGRNVYGALVADGAADVFLTYCTNAVARREQPQLLLLPVPENINVAARYGVALLRPAGEGARRFMAYLLGPQGQAVLRGHGFAPP